MKNDELDRLLRQAQVPERPPEYWQEFPQTVARELTRAERPNSTRPRHHLQSRMAWGIGLAAACVTIGLAIGFKLGRHSAPDSMDRADLSKYLREIETLFPQQVQAIVFEEGGPRLVLSDKADVPKSPPVFLRICANKNCLSFITFSGQRVRMNGEELEVLMDAKGGVIVVGRQAVWSSAGTRSDGLPFRIEARPLDVSG